LGHGKQKYRQIDRYFEESGARIQDFEVMASDWKCGGPYLYFSGEGLRKNGDGSIDHDESRDASGCNDVTLSMSIYVGLVKRHA
jgi:hypothetical protein